MCPTFFHLGPITLHTYGLMIAIGFLLAYRFARVEFFRRKLDVDAMDSAVMVLMIVSLFGARVFYFLLDSPTALGDDPLSFFRIWEGGLVFYGGFVFGLATIAVLSWRARIHWMDMADALAGPLLLGQAFGRVGCFFAGCCYGRPTESFMGVVFTHPESLAPLGQRLHPTQLYEALGVLLLFIVSQVLKRRFSKRGLMIVYYLVGYGTLRFLVEFLRDDFRGPHVGGLSPAQWISAAGVITGLILWIYANQREKTS